MLYLNQIDSSVINYFASWINLNSTSPNLFEKTVGLIEPGMVRQHFLCYTIADIICFCHYYPHLIIRNGSNIFSAVGYNPCSNFLKKVNDQFSKAKIVTVFDNDILGNVLDCKVLLTKIGRDSSFKLLPDRLLFSYDGNDFVVPEPTFSFNRFRILTGIRTNQRTIKPKGAVSFSQLLLK